MQMMTRTYEQVPYFPTESSLDESIQEPMQNPLSEVTSEQTQGERTFHKTHKINVPLGRGEQSSCSTQQNCYTCGENGHYSRGCKQPPRRPKGSEGHLTREFMPHKWCRTRSGDHVPWTLNDLNLSVKIRRGAYLKTKMGSRKILTILDSGCEQTVIGRSSVEKVPLELTNETLSTTDGTKVPYIGEMMQFMAAVRYYLFVKLLISRFHPSGWQSVPRKGEQNLLKL